VFVVLKIEWSLNFGHQLCVEKSLNLYIESLAFAVAVVADQRLHTVVRVHSARPLCSSASLWAALCAAVRALALHVSSHHLGRKWCTVRAAALHSSDGVCCPLLAACCLLLAARCSTHTCRSFPAGPNLAQGRINF